MLNTALRYKVDYVGQEKQPVLLIDNLVLNARSLVDYAMQQQDVLPAAGYYPGLRSAAPKAYQDLLSQQLSPLLCGVFNLAPEQLSQADSYYSLVTTPVDELSIEQQLPHFDQPKQDELAVIHYLCNEEHGGTSFYRHKRSGFESINQARSVQYLQTLENEIKQGGMPLKPCYINGENVFFERIASVAASFNRAVVYRCSSLHSGDIPSDYSFDLNPYSGRFTIASFIHR